MSTNSQRLRAIALRGLCGGWPELAEIGGDDDVRFAVDSPVEGAGFEPSVPSTVSLVHSGACDATRAAIGKPRNARSFASTRSASDFDCLSLVLSVTWILGRFWVCSPFNIRNRRSSY